MVVVDGIVWINFLSGCCHQTHTKVVEWWKYTRKHIPQFLYKAPVKSVCRDILQLTSETCFTKKILKLMNWFGIRTVTHQRKKKH